MKSEKRQQINASLKTRERKYQEKCRLGKGRQMETKSKREKKSEGRKWRKQIKMTTDRREKKAVERETIRK